MMKHMKQHYLDGFSERFNTDYQQWLKDGEVRLILNALIMYMFHKFMFLLIS